MRRIAGWVTGPLAASPGSNLVWLRLAWERSCCFDGIGGAVTRDLSQDKEHEKTGHDFSFSAG